MLALSASSTALKSEAQIEKGTCSLKIDFKTSPEVRGWRAVNDGVMGGLSSGGPRFENGQMTFQGVINTNGGGFSSVRKSVSKGILSNAPGIKLRVRTDGRDYKLTLRSSATWRGRPVSFQAPIPTTKADEWAEVLVPFSNLRGTIFGRDVRNAKFDKSAVSQIGIILADGRDGSFRLDVDWITDCAII